MGKLNGTGALKPDKRYTLEEWRSWPEDERWELIDGIVYNMSPSPNVGHQEKGFDLGRRLGNFLEDKPCRVFLAPLDVFLDDESEESAKTVVQPDVLVVCDQAKIHEDGIRGAPDFVAEVLSDSTANKDFSIKKEIYERHGVREYWLIQPDTGTVFQYIREGRIFTPLQEHRRGEPVKSAVIEGFTWVCG